MPWATMVTHSNGEKDTGISSPDGNSLEPPILEDTTSKLSANLALAAPQDMLQQDIAARNSANKDLTMDLKNSPMSSFDDKCRTDYNAFDAYTLAQNMPMPKTVTMLIQHFPYHRELAPAFEQSLKSAFSRIVNLRLYRLNVMSTDDDFLECLSTHSSENWLGDLDENDHDDVVKRNIVEIMKRSHIAHEQLRQLKLYKCLGYLKDNGFIFLALLGTTKDDQGSFQNQLERIPDEADPKFLLP